MQAVEMRSFINLEEGDDLYALKNKNNTYTIAITGQSFYMVGNYVPIAQSGGNILGLAKIVEVYTKMSKTGIIMTYVTFEKIDISNELKKSFKVLYQMQEADGSSATDKYDTSDAYIPGIVSADKLIKGITGTSSNKSNKAPQTWNASNMIVPNGRRKDVVVDDDDDDEGRALRRRLFRDI